MSTGLKFLLALCFTFLASSLRAATQMAVVTSINGQAEIFSKPLAGTISAGSKVLFEGQVYIAKKARVGAKLNYNQIIRTAPASKAKITFKNGDTMMIGPGSALVLSEIKLEGGDKEKGEVLNLIYGKVRSIISKVGPRNTMQIKTKTAVAGVRGTDFYTRYRDSEGATDVSVIRGKVAIAMAALPGEKRQQEQTLNRGYSAQVTIPPNQLGRVEPGRKRSAKNLPTELPTKGQVAGYKAPKLTFQQKSNQLQERGIKVSVLSKEALQDIHKESTVQSDLEQLKLELPQTDFQEIQNLESMAASIILQDLKSEDPATYEKLKGKEGQLTIDQINESVLEEIKSEAPEAARAEKLSEEELLKSLENNEDVYKKYFK